MRRIPTLMIAIGAVLLLTASAFAFGGNRGGGWGGHMMAPGYHMNGGYGQPTPMGPGYAPGAGYTQHPGFNGNFETCWGTDFNRNAPNQAPQTPAPRPDISR